MTFIYLTRHQSINRLLLSVSVVYLGTVPMLLLALVASSFRVWERKAGVVVRFGRKLAADCDLQVSSRFRTHLQRLGPGRMSCGRRNLPGRENVHFLGLQLVDLAFKAALRQRIHQGLLLSAIARGRHGPVQAGQYRS